MRIPKQDAVFWARRTRTPVGRSTTDLRSELLRLTHASKVFFITRRRAQAALTTIGADALHATSDTLGNSDDPPSPLSLSLKRALGRKHITDIFSLGGLVSLLGRTDGTMKAGGSRDAVRAWQT
jgi:hypothetical protein